MTSFKRLAFSTLAVGILWSAPAHATNVLVIIGDDIAVDKVSGYAADYAPQGYAPNYLPATPAIDGIGAAGLRFTRAWATPLCSPTRASFQTGKHPFRTGVGTALGSNAEGVDPAAHLMMAESFHNFGYSTGFFGKWHIGTKDSANHLGYPGTSPFFDEPHPVLSGWDRFFGIYDGYPGAGRSFFDWPRVGWIGGVGGSGHTADETEHHTDRTSEVAQNWIARQDGPWLAVVAFSAPHSPDTSSYAWQYGDADVTQYRTPALSCLATSSCGNEPRAVYQALAEHVDLQIEALLNGIDPQVMDDTLIFFVGDNGTPTAVAEAPFDAAGRGKGTTYENGVRVPLVVADGATWRTGAPGRIASPGREADIAVSSTDIYETIHEAILSVGVLGVDSDSFAVCFGNTDPMCGYTERRYGYSETYTTNLGGIASAKIAVRYGHDKMVAYYDAAGGCMEETFYRTDTDPMETAPQAWTGLRADRLRDFFTNMHAAEPTSWANANGPLVGFCFP